MYFTVLKKNTLDRQMNKEDLIKMPLEAKIVYSEQIIQEALKKYKKTAIAWTGGKDSTFLLWLVRRVCQANPWPLPSVIFINEGDSFEEIFAFIKEVSKKWQISVIELKNEDILKQVTKVGDIIKVEKLDEINKRELKKLGFNEKEFPFKPESFIGNHLMKTLPLNTFIEKNNIRALFTAIRWDEQEARKNETYFSPREIPPHIRVHPILHFKERDIWDATIKYNIPFNKLYAQGYRSLGARSTTFKVADIPAWEQDLENTQERAGRDQDKEAIMQRLRDLGYM